MITRVPTIDQSDMEFVYGDDKPPSPISQSPEFREKSNPRCLKRSARIVLEKMESYDEDNIPDYLLKVRLILMRKYHRWYITYYFSKYHYLPLKNVQHLFLRRLQLNMLMKMILLIISLKISCKQSKEKERFTVRKMKQCTNVTGYKKDLHNNIYFLINQHKYSKLLPY